MAEGFKASDVAARYAQALFDLAVQHNNLDVVDSDLRSLMVMRAESMDLRTLIGSPRFTRMQQSAALAALAERAGFSSTTRKLLGLVGANRRVAALPAIVAAFQRLVAERRGIVAAEVTTAIRMTPAQLGNLTSALRSALGKDPQIAAKVDPAILAGIKVKVGSRLYDASLKSKLESMKQTLRRA